MVAKQIERSAVAGDASDRADADGVGEYLAPVGHDDRRIVGEIAALGLDVHEGAVLEAVDVLAGRGVDHAQVHAEVDHRDFADMLPRATGESVDAERGAEPQRAVDRLHATDHARRAANRRELTFR